MRREDMERMRALKQEIETLEDEFMHLPEETIADAYGDYKTGRKRVKQIYTTRKKGGAALAKKIREKVEQLTENLQAMEDFLDGVEDPEIRDMFRLYYAAGWTLREIGERKNYDTSTVGKKMNRWWVEHSNNSKK